MLTEEKLAATVPWQEVMSGSEVSVSCHYHAVYIVDSWRASFLKLLLTTVFMLYVLVMSQVRRSCNNENLEHHW